MLFVVYDLKVQDHLHIDALVVIGIVIQAEKISQFSCKVACLHYINKGKGQQTLFTATLFLFPTSNLTQESICRRIAFNRFGGFPMLLISLREGRSDI